MVASSSVIATILRAGRRALPAPWNSMREHDCLGAAITAGGQQFERAAAGGLGDVLAARHWLLGGNLPRRL
jgi:hypothetical protein